jgi:hypothetical protein
MPSQEGDKMNKKPRFKTTIVDERILIPTCWECNKKMPKDKRDIYDYFCSKECEDKHWKSYGF